MVFPVRIRTSRRWHKVKISRTELSQLLKLRKELGIVDEFFRSPEDKKFFWDLTFEGRGVYILT